MAVSIKKEYAKLLNQQYAIKQQLEIIPIGYLSKKNIDGKQRYYLQRRVGKRVLSTYIQAGLVSNIERELQKRKKYEAEMVAIQSRIKELERAATHIGHGLYCDLMLYKMAVGMDNLSSERKERSISFAASMNAIEGVDVSEETLENINEWQNDNKKFITVFSETLKRYGFPVGV